MATKSALADDHEDKGISISSDQTVASGHQPVMNIQAAGFSQISLRAYRVADPVRLLKLVTNKNAMTFENPTSVFHHDTDKMIEPLDKRIVGLMKGTTLAAKWDVVLKRQEGPSFIWTHYPRSSAQTTVYATRDLAVPVKEKGVYLIEASHGKLRAYTIVFVTDITLIARNANGTTHVYAADRQTGAPVPDCDVISVSETESEVRTRTDQRGMAEVHMAKSGQILLVAMKGSDVAAIKPAYWPPHENEPGKAYTYTDRPIYRPGDTVHFKGVFRDPGEKVLGVPKGVALKLIVKGPNYQAFTEQDLRTSSMGTVSGEVPLPLDAKLGVYELTIGPKEREQTGDEDGLESGGRHYSGGGTTFTVQEYKKPELKVRVTAEKTQVIQGENLNVTVDAHYFFGQPVKFARVDYSADATDSYRVDPEKYGEFSNSYSGAGRTYLIVGKGSGVLDEAGAFKFTIATTAAQSKRDQDIIIRAHITDETGRVITGGAQVLAAYGSFRLSSSQRSHFYSKGEAAELDISAADYDDRPVATSFRVEVSRFENNEYKNVSTPPVAGKTAENGKGEVSLKLEEPGSYKVRIVATDSNGREVQADTGLTVLGGEPRQYAFAEHGAIVIKADRKTYAPGDKARLLFLGEKENLHYFVTIESGNSTESYQVDAAGKTAELMLPIKPEFAPNFYVHAIAVRGGKTYQSEASSASFAVASTEHVLKIEVQPSQGQFEPGEEATMMLRTHTANGKPASADLSLGVVDASIYALGNDPTGDMLTAFYPQRKDRIHTEDSLTFWFQDAAGRGAPIGSTSGVIGGVLGGTLGGVGGILVPDAFVEPRVRKDFPDTAYWVADVQTNENGEAQVNFRVPDTLTTWRTTARGATENTRVGSAVNEVISRKNVLLRVSAPRFLRAGDEVTISAFIHNYLPTAKRARVSLDVEGLEVVSGTTRDVEVPSGGDTGVSWVVRATSVGNAKMTAKALTNEESDAIENAIPVHPLGVKLRVGRSGILQLGSDSHTETMAFPADSVPQTRRAVIQIAPSLAAAAMKALNFLTTYPYGCTEQTMSSFGPNIAVATVMKQLGMKSDVNEAELHKKVSAGLARLYKYQHPSGGWGWWENDPDHSFMTAYVAAGLSQARAAGYKVDGEALKRGRKWLVDNFNKNVSADMRAYFLYAITLDKPDRKLMDQVWKNKSSLSPYGTALLGLGLQAASDERAGQLTPEIEKAAHGGSLRAHWTANKDPLLEFSGNEDREATALAVQFLSRQDPKSELLPKAVAWLMENRDQGEYWQSTKPTAMVLLALTEYLKQSGELQSGTGAELYLNDSKVGSYALNSEGKNGGAVTVELDASQLKEAQNHLRLEKKGGGTIYWSLSSEYFTTADTAYNKGVKIERKYQKLDRVRPEAPGDPQHAPTPAGESYKSVALNGAVEPGDILAVKVTVTGDACKYLMVNDPIPAGTELIESTAALDGAIGYSPFYEGHEYHDDRASFFRTSFKGSGEFIYFLRVVNPGKFGISPGSAETMYQPDVFSTTSMDTLTVK
jgi:hypothetical protein